MLTTATTLDDGDVLIVKDADQFYFGIVDCASYEGFIGGEYWRYQTLTELIVRQMNQERLFAWGCPEGRWRIRFSRHPLPALPIGPHEFAGFVQTTGGLCLSCYDGFAACADFKDQRLPYTSQDWSFSAPPGRYRVPVRQLFEWDGYEQFCPDHPRDGTTPGPDYLVSFVLDPDGPAQRWPWVPLAENWPETPLLP